MRERVPSSSKRIVLKIGLGTIHPMVRRNFLPIVQIPSVIVGVNSKILPTELPLQDNLAVENQERALGGSLANLHRLYLRFNLSAYYEKLDRRVDDWMDKVNNLSPRDINRFQFRKGRSAQPVSLFSEPDRKQIHLLHLPFKNF